MNTMQRRNRSRLAAAGIGLALIVAASAPAAAPAGGAEPPPSPAADTLVLAPVGGPHDDVALVRNGGIYLQDLEPATYALAGDFTSSPGSDVFLYSPGPGIDGILDVVPGGPEERAASSTFTPVPVSGTYVPVVGNFGYGPEDDIIWYGRGAVPDTIWFFRPDGSHVTARMPISGHSYRPTVLDANGDEWDDIVWYAPGPAGDSLWLMGPDGFQWHRSVPQTIDGADYRLIPGHFADRPEGQGQDRLVFHSPTLRDSIWTFDPDGRRSSAPFSDVIAYEPVVGDFHGRGLDDLLMYRRHGPEDMVVFHPDGRYEAISPLVVWGDYDHAVGDFDGNGRDDIVWTRDGIVRFWYFSEEGYSTQRYDTTATDTIPLTSVTDGEPT